MKQKFYLLVFALLGISGVIIGQGVQSLQDVVAVPGMTCNYDFTDGSILDKEEHVYQDVFTTNDGILTIKRNEGDYFYCNWTTHGLVLRNKNSIEIPITGNARISFGVCKNTPPGSAVIITDPSGVEIEEVSLYSKDGECSFNYYDYTGDAGVLTLKVVSVPTSLVTLHTLTIKNHKTAVYAEPGMTTSYCFTDGSIMPQERYKYYDIFSPEDDVVTIQRNNGDQFRYSDPTHGVQLYNKNLLDIRVPGSSLITFATCGYNPQDAIFIVTDDSGVELDRISLASSSQSICPVIPFKYTGEATILTFTISSSKPVYMHAITVKTLKEPTMAAIPGMTYAYEFYDGSIIPQNTSINYDIFTTDNNILNIYRNNGEKFYYSDNVHGLSLKNRNSIDVVVSDNTLISLTTCKLNPENTVLILSDDSGVILDTISASTAPGDDCSVFHYRHIDNPGVLTFTVSSSNSFYLHNIFIRNEKESTVVAEPEMTYSYCFNDGSVLERHNNTCYNTFSTNDGILDIYNNSGKKFRCVDHEHGLELYNKNSLNIVVAGDALISFETCKLNPAGAAFILTDAYGIGSDIIPAVVDDCSVVTYQYTGDAGVLMFTISTSSTFYLHGLTIQNGSSEPGPGPVPTDKIDAWDFGAAQLDEEIYTNWLTEDIINSWYPGVEPGTDNTLLPRSFTAGILTWVGGNDDRLCTSNTNLTRFNSDGSPAIFEGETFTGSIYSNSTTSDRYISLTLNAADEITIYSKAQVAGGKLVFEYKEDNTQKDEIAHSTILGVTRFVAKKKGTYHIYGVTENPSYYRILRKEGGGISGITDEKVKEVELKQVGNEVKIADISSPTTISVYGINGKMNKNFTITEDTQFTLAKGFWIVKATNAESETVLKVLIP